MKTPLVRIPLFILVFIAVLVLPWYFSAMILIGLTIYYPLYLEVILFSFLFDILYSSIYRFPYTALSTAVVFLVVVMFVRTRIRF